MSDNWYHNTRLVILIMQGESSALVEESWKIGSNKSTELLRLFDGTFLGLFG